MVRRRRGIIWICGIAICVGMPAVVAAQPDVTSHALGVSRHTAVAFTAEEAGEIFEEMGHMLQTVDGGRPDVECAVAFTLDGRVGVFTESEAPGTISIREDFDAVMRVDPDADAKVVESIQWCKRRINNGTFWGCSDGTSFAVVSTMPSVEHAAVVWAHEFGHTRMGFAEYHRNDPGAVMHAEHDLDNRRVDAHECERFRE